MTNNSIKRLWITIAVIFFVTATGVIAEVKRKQDKKISITLSEQEWGIVLQGLSELPMKTSGGVYSSIMQQAQMQLQAQQQKPKADTTKKKQ